MDAPSRQASVSRWYPVTIPVVFLLLCAAAVLLFWPSSVSLFARAASSDSEASSVAVEAHPSGVASTALQLDLVAAMFEAGLGLSVAISRLAEVTAGQTCADLRAVSRRLNLGMTWQQAWSPVKSTALTDFREALAFTAQSGAPSANYVYAQAATLRAETHRAQQAKAAALGVRLVLPMGLCALPAFMCLTVVPVVVALFPSF